MRPTFARPLFVLCTRFAAVIALATAAQAVSGCSGEPTEPSAEQKAMDDKAAQERAAADKAAAEKAAADKAAADKASEDASNAVMAPPEGAKPALSDPSLATATAPNTYKVAFETTKGTFVVLVHRDWAPNGADRLYNLVEAGFFDGCKFFRAIDGFMVQFGLSPYPAISQKWREATIDDDPVKEHNTRGRVTFATAGPNTRTTQLFINYVDNSNLDRMGFAPFGEVVEGMEQVVDALYKGYGEGAPRGRGPDQGMIQDRGNTYLDKDFPQLDGIKSATIAK